MRLKKKLAKFIRRNNLKDLNAESYWFQPKWLPVNTRIEYMAGPGNTWLKLSFLFVSIEV